MKKNKIVHLVRDISGTGGGNIVLNISNFFIENDIEVIIVTDIPVEDHKTTNLKFIIIPFGILLYKWKTENKTTRTLKHLLQILNFLFFSIFLAFYYKIKGFVIINNNNESFFGNITTVHNVFSAEIINNKTLYRLLNPVMFIRILKEQLFLRFKIKGIIVANSNDTLHEIKKFINPLVDICVIPSGVDLKNYTASNIKKIDKNFVLLFVGHEFERKGLSLIIDALTELPDDIILKVVGGRGSSIKFYKNQVLNNNLKDRVQFLGSVQELKRIYLSSDVFLLPSNYEGLPLVCLESMALGLPNLVTFVGGMKDLIVDGENGYFVKKDSKDIAEKILLLYNDKKAYSKMSVSAVNSVQEYDWSIISKKYLDQLSNYFWAENRYKC